MGSWESPSQMLLETSFFSIPVNLYLVYFLDAQIGIYFMEIQLYRALKSWAVLQQLYHYKLGIAYISSSWRDDHVDGTKNEEGNANLHLVSTTCTFHVRLQHRLNHPAATSAEEVVNKWKGD